MGQYVSPPHLHFLWFAEKGSLVPKIVVVAVEGSWIELVKLWNFPGRTFGAVV